MPGPLDLEDPVERIHEPPGPRGDMRARPDGFPPPEPLMDFRAHDAAVAGAAD